MGKMQRRKGAVNERDAANWIKPIYPDARRSANQAAGAMQPDVDGTPFWVEVKSGKSIGLWAALQQAIYDRKVANDGRPILLYLKRDRTVPVVVMLASEFMDECLKR